VDFFISGAGRLTQIPKALLENTRRRPPGTELSRIPALKELRKIGKNREESLWLRQGEM
jgi:hypothetical protein